MQNPIPSRVKAFLDALAEELRHLKGKEAVIDEIAGHLLDAIDDLRERGLGAEEAEREALSRMGDPRRLGRALRVARRPWYLRWFVLLPSALAGAGVAAVVCLTFLAREEMRKAEEQIRSDDWAFNLLLKDMDSLKKYSFLRPGSQKHDAGVFLNDRIEWEGEKAQGPTDLSISMTLEQRRILQDKKWLELGDPTELRHVDLSWMKELRRYDHWDLWMSPGPGKENVDRELPWFVISVPNYLQIVSFAKLRYLRALRDGDALPALREIRQLTLLTYSNELLISSMITVSLLKMEADFYREALHRHLLRAKDWKPMPEEGRQAFKRVAYGVAQWINLFTPSERIQALVERADSIPGLCGALMEEKSTERYMRLYFAPRAWFEPDLRPNFARMDSLYKTAGNRCQLNIVRAAGWLDENIPPMDFNTEDLPTVYYQFSAKIPYLRRLVGTQLFTGIRPNFISLYRDAQDKLEKADRAPAQQKR